MVIVIHDAVAFHWRLLYMFADEWMELAHSPFRFELGTEARARYDQQVILPDGRMQFRIRNYERVHGRETSISGTATQLDPTSTTATIAFDANVVFTDTNETAFVYPEAQRSGVLTLRGYATNPALLALSSPQVTWLLCKKNITPKEFAAALKAAKSFFEERQLPAPTIQTWGKA